MQLIKFLKERNISIVEIWNGDDTMEDKKINWLDISKSVFSIWQCESTQGGPIIWAKGRHQCANT